MFKLEFPGDPVSCRKITKMLGDIPWILLTKGGKYEKFKDDLRVAMANGASGFLAGRSIWQEFTKYTNKEREIFFNTDVPERFNEITKIASS